MSFLKRIFGKTDFHASKVIIDEASPIVNWDSVITTINAEKRKKPDL